jgi:ankyrin repeat protein
MDVAQVRKQAKELVKAARGGDEEALRRLGGREPILARAQLVVARELGYASWRALLAAAEADTGRFVEAATDRDRARAEAMLEARPEIGQDPWASLVLGEVWHGDPNAPGGPRGWSPLLYACHSVFVPRDAVRDLLARGADPNRRFATDWGETTALYGAAGVVHDPEITGLLLEADADPDDNESLYHSVEAQDPACLRLLLEHGAETRGTNALLHALDFDRLESVRMLLGAGADPNERPSLAWAVRKGRGPEFLRLLAAHGAELDAPFEESGAESRTAFQLAMLRGAVEAAETLAALGASTELGDADAAVAAFARGESSAASLPAELDGQQRGVLILAAVTGRLEDVLDVVEPDFRGSADGSPVGTLLHHAAWYGNPRAVETLLERGADPHARTQADFETPAAWAALGSRWWRTPGFDYVGVMQQLVEAGAELEPRFAEVAQGPLADWLAERL